MSIYGYSLLLSSILKVFPTAVTMLTHAQHCISITKIYDLRTHTIDINVTIALRRAIVVEYTDAFIISGP